MELLPSMHKHLKQQKTKSFMDGVPEELLQSMMVVY